MVRKRLHYISNKAAIYLQAALLATPILFGALPNVSAAQLENRSVRISTAQLGSQAQHLFIFDIASTANLGSLSFTYCTNSPRISDPCSPPAGLDLDNATLGTQTGNTGFSYAAGLSTTNTVVLSRVPVAGTPGQSTYRIDNVLNPTTPGETTFIRIISYSSTDATGPVIDSGAVVFSTVDIFQVDAYVPPFLTFCVGVYVTLNCNSVTGSYIDIGELGSNRTATGMMQFSGATNDATGFTTYLNGFTMTSGNNIIDPLSGNAGSAQGVSQFGLNLRANSSPSFGLDPVGLGASAPTGGYGTPNSFRFVNGEAITVSNVSTDFRIFTAAYIVNVPKTQPPGVYVTTMTYTAIASF